MSKWFSARSNLLIAALLVMPALSACNRQDDAASAPEIRASTVVDPEMRVDSVPQEEPGVARTQWRAANDLARMQTGNLRVSIESVRGGPVVFAFATGVTVRAQMIGVVPADNRSGVGSQSYAAVLGGDPRVDVFLFRVLDENVASSAAQGGLCGREQRARHLAVSEYVDDDGHWVFKIAAFRSEQAPGVSGADPLLCGAYPYAAQ